MRGVKLRAGGGGGEGENETKETGRREGGRPLSELLSS